MLIFGDTAWLFFSAPSGTSLLSNTLHYYAEIRSGSRRAWECHDAVSFGRGRRLGQQRPGRADASHAVVHE